MTAASVVASCCTSLPLSPFSCFIARDFVFLRRAASFLLSASSSPFSASLSTKPSCSFRFGSACLHSPGVLALLTLLPFELGVLLLQRCDNVRLRKSAFLQVAEPIRARAWFHYRTPGTLEDTYVL